MPKLPKALEALASDDELWIPVAAAWLVGGPLFTVWGFYVGTVLGPDHRIDLQWNELSGGLVGAACGAAVGLAVAIYATFIFPEKWRASRADSDHH
jgi:hypothetical protein